MAEREDDIVHNQNIQTHANTDADAEAGVNVEAQVEAEADPDPDPAADSEGEASAAVLELFLRRRSNDVPGIVVASHLSVEIQPAFGDAVQTSMGTISERFQCQVCFVQPACRTAHCFCPPTMCTDCMRRFIEVRISMLHFTGQCAQCLYTYSDDFLSTLLSADMFKKFERTRIRLEAASDPNAFWCSNPKCEQLLRRATLSSRITCESCNTTMCARCSQVHPWYYSCTVANLPSSIAFQLWKLGGGEVGNGVKKCPKCRIYIEKNHGCPHMTCVHCRYEFCWHCGNRHNTNHRRTCNLHKFLDHPFWGRSLCTRAASKTVGIPVALGVGAAGVALACAYVVVATPVFGCYSVYRLAKHAYFTRRATRWSGNPVAATIADIVIEGGPEDPVFTLLQEQFSGREIAQGYFLAYTEIETRPALLYFRSQDVAPLSDMDYPCQLSLHPNELLSLEAAGIVDTVSRGIVV